RRLAILMVFLIVVGTGAVVWYVISQSTEKRNLALHRPVKGSDVYFRTGPPAYGTQYLTDGQRTSTPDVYGYSTDHISNKPEWVYVDLGIDAKLGSVKLYPITAIPSV